MASLSGSVVGHILIVDDQQNWRDVLSELLQSQHEVETVSNLDEAHSAILEFNFDVAVLDVRLIDKDTFNVDGLDLLRMIKKKRPSTGVVILTGYPDSVRKEVLEEYGADAFMFKVPQGRTFDSGGFRTLVQNLVAKYRG